MTLHVTVILNCCISLILALCLGLNPGCVLHDMPGGYSQPPCRTAFSNQYACTHASVITSVIVICGLHWLTGGSFHSRDVTSIVKDCRVFQEHRHFLGCLHS